MPELFKIVPTSIPGGPASPCWWKCYGKGKDLAGVRAYAHLFVCVIALLFSVLFELREDRTDLCAGQRLIRHTGRKLRPISLFFKWKNPDFANSWDKFLVNYPGNRPWYADIRGIFSHIILIVVLLICVAFLIAAMYYGL